LIHDCPVEQCDNAGSSGGEPRCNYKYLLPGLVPDIHVLAAEIAKTAEIAKIAKTAEIAKTPEDVDGRVKPGQGDLWLCIDRSSQPFSSIGQPWT
jgi:hypothetical protein